MQIIDTAISEVKIIVPKVFGDARGYFFESWNAEKYSAAGIDCNWVQDNESKSKFGVLRGLHYQAAPYTQAKLVRVIEGAVLDVAVDIRKGSPTFGRHVAVKLSSENKYQLFVPRGFAHGFVVLSDSVTFAYKCDNAYMPSHERGIAFNDPALGIDWLVNLSEYILSPKDTANPLLADAELFDFNTKEYLQQP
ncbi:MAG: dTDP-4-dehydrorhamnose 3,5-epimerase [Lentisphaeria bacterium]|nr:dTDP-4-dehydrorhamnose 3,5-epimerase [Lentisphaeria bacterium]